MKIISNKKAVIRRKMAVERYDKIGPSAVITMGDKLKMNFDLCVPCENETPTLSTVSGSECLVCGSNKKVD